MKLFRAGEQLKTLGIGDNFVEPSSNGTDCHDKGVSGTVLFFSAGTIFSFDCSIVAISKDNALCGLLFSVDLGYVELSAIAWSSLEFQSFHGEFDKIAARIGTLRLVQET